MARRAASTSDAPASEQGSPEQGAATQPAAAASSRVGTRKASADDPLKGAHPLVGVASVAETIGPAGPRTAEEQRAAIQKEYGDYVAVAAITHDGALAYNVGDPVPAANVDAWGYLGLGLVKRRSTKAAQAALEDAAPPQDPTDPDAPV